MLASSCLLISPIGCSIGDLVNGRPLPSDVPDPKVVKTPEGAMGAYYATVLAFRRIIVGSSTVNEISGNSEPDVNVINGVGLLTDELEALETRLISAEAAFPDVRRRYTVIDARLDDVPYGDPIPIYNGLHKTRARAREAIGALQKYYPHAPLALTGHLLAIEGMAEVLLAELYCSGIPLSTLDFDGDYTLQPGSSTEAVFEHALTLLDSAASIAIDSTDIVHFISVGRARALLGLHNVAAAARAVSSVPTTYRYTIPMEENFVNIFYTTNNTWAMSVGNKEGGIGQAFVTSGDPRTVSDSLTGVGGPWFPRKYRDAGVTNPGSNPGKSPIVFASGIEARLIEAEAALVADNPTWLTILNALRTACVSGENCAEPAPAGTGGIGSLPLLADPGLATLPAGATLRDVRLNLLFQERAYWLFLTGRRQADLRRLVQQYGREPNTVYPSGLWGRQKLAVYGSRISFLVPNRELVTNPLYRGCED